ncbi:MAG: MotA/TolQ/ExbB proton channel family protein [Nitrosomonas sp.]|nr:MotA/TolQ/ExbB proton channel family protein [Nitrosomonas sp.]
MCTYKSFAVSLAILLLPAIVTAQGVENAAPVPARKDADQTTQPVAPKQTTSSNSVSAADPATLSAAYKREFAFLEEQKRELNKRLTEFRGKRNGAEQTLLQRINALERENLKLTTQEDDLRSQLTSAEHKDDSLRERSELIDMTYSQADSTLKKYNRSLEKNSAFAEGDDQTKLSMLFSEATNLLGSLSNIYSEAGKFFLLDGTEVAGNIVQVGNIAAYGVSEKGSGILVPAGNNRFRLWAEPASDVAEAMLAGSSLPVLKMFLFESRERAIDFHQDKTVKEIIDSGGVIGWIIVFLGGVAVVVTIVRAAILYLNSVNGQKISVETLGMLAHQQMDKALAYCQGKKGPFARLLTTTLSQKYERDQLEDVISETLLHETEKLDRFSSTILVIASVSPLLGLLGTVTGMISTFDIITEFGTGDPKLLSGGISIALVTTQLGLIVAIPAVLLGTMLNSWAETIKRELEGVALKVSNIITGNIPQPAPGDPENPTMPTDLKPKDQTGDVPAGGLSYSTT